MVWQRLNPTDFVDNFSTSSWQLCALWSREADVCTTLSKESKPVLFSFIFLLSANRMHVSYSRVGKLADVMFSSFSQFKFSIPLGPTKAMESISSKDKELKSDLESVAACLAVLLKFTVVPSNHENAFFCYKKQLFLPIRAEIYFITPVVLVRYTACHRPHFGPCVG